MLRLISVVLLLLFSAAIATAAESPARRLAAELLVLTGTAAVFDSPFVDAALADPEPFLGPAATPRRERLLDDAGFRKWQPPRAWVLVSRREGAVEHWDNLASVYEAGVVARGFRLVPAPPLPAAEEALSLLKFGTDHPGLPVLLQAYGADALILVRGRDWGMWSRGAVRQGSLPHRTGLFAGVLGESLATLQQWPEAGARVVIQVAGIRSLADHAAVQAALQAIPGTRPPQVIRVGHGQAWFAVAAPDRDALALALDGEPRLPAVTGGGHGGLSEDVVEAQRLASPLLLRRWVPDAVPKPAAAAPSPL